MEVQKTWTVQLRNELSLPEGVEIRVLYYDAEVGFVLLEGKRYATTPSGDKVYLEGKYQLRADNSMRVPVLDAVTKEPKLDENGQPMTIGEMDAWLLKYHPILNVDITDSIRRKEGLISEPLVIEL